VQKIADLYESELKWFQPHSMKMHYKLLAGEEKIACLHFRSSVGSFATGEAAEGSWTFKRIGFFKTRITVREVGSKKDLAVFYNNTWAGGGTLVLPGEGKLRITTNFWQTQFEIKTEENQPLIRMSSGGLFHLSAPLDITAEANEMPELPWLVLLGMYLLVMLHNDAGAATTVAGASLYS
jgi:hypothetical protein